MRPDSDHFRELLLSGRPLLDVRAPVEFARGALPGAHNLPLMMDQERAQVGRCYKQAGAAAAVELGHQLVSGAIKDARVAAWAAFAAQHPDGYLYCFRGGLRSQIAQQWLQQATGVRYPRLRGGYKAVRGYLLGELARLSHASPLLVLGGMTGTGKTEILQTLPHGLDLEGHARHRGSSFGLGVLPQPTQIDFEHALTVDWLRREASGLTQYVLEDESRLIGRCAIPLPLYQRMQHCPMVWLEDSQANRVARILDEYVVRLSAALMQAAGPQAGMQQFAARMRGSLARIAKRLGGLRYRQLAALMEDALAAQARGQGVDAHQAWIVALLTDYYDPMYAYQRREKAARIVFAGEPAAVRQWLAAQGRPMQA